MVDPNTPFPIDEEGGYSVFWKFCEERCDAAPVIVVGGVITLFDPGLQTAPLAVGPQLAL